VANTLWGPNVISAAAADNELTLAWCEFWVGNGTNRFTSKRMGASVRAAVGTAPSI
jgi:hypothetical protein